MTSEPPISPLHGPDIVALLTAYPRPWRAAASDDPAYVILVDARSYNIRAEPAAYGRLIVASVNALRADTPPPPGDPPHA
jgi:hypothetical protein